MEKIAIGASIKFGWETFKRRPGILIGGFALAAVIAMVFSAVLDTKGMELSLITVLMSLASMVIGVFVEMGLTMFFLKAHDAVDGVSINHLWNPKPFWKYVGGKILTSIIVLIGFVLLIIPGIIAALGLMFVTYLIVDRHMNPIDAIKESWRITKGHKWELFLLALALIGLNIVGFLLLLVGLLVTVPVSMLAVVHVYRTLEHKASEVTVTA